MDNQQLWYDVDSNKHYILKAGNRLVCDDLGKRPNCFIPYFTGHADYRARVRLSAETDKFSVLPSVSPSLSRRHISSLCLNKLDGYAQFPHPKKGLMLSNNSFTTKLKQRIKWKINTNKYHSEARRSCSINRYNSIRKEGDSGLPSKRKLHNSNIKVRHMNLLRGTFTPLKGQNEEGPEVESELTRNRQLTRSYNEIKSSLRKEAVELGEETRSPAKEKRHRIKGLYDVRVPTEGELYVKAKKWRTLMNAKASAQEAKYEQKDLLLLRKRREQATLKQNAIKSLLRSKEKALRKKIILRNNMTQLD